MKEAKVMMATKVMVAIKQVKVMVMVKQRKVCDEKVEGNGGKNAEGNDRKKQVKKMMEMVEMVKMKGRR